MLLQPRTTCWRAERADRAALLIDMADYFTAAKVALLKARSTIHLLNWAFDPDTLFDPQPGGTGPASDRIGPFLRDLACARPELDVRILCWRSALPVSATQHFFPHRAKKCFDGTPVHFLLDATVPLGACHHQKMIVIDDQVAFCGGGDIGPDRWDTAEHLDDDPRREKSRVSNEDFDSRHELMSVVDGAAARALGDHFRSRWERATGDRLVPPAPSNGDAWPECVKVELNNVTAGISRTQPGWKGYPEIRENEALHLAGVAAAERCIYMENQYFTSPLMAEALALRLAEPDGPEVVLISTQHSPSWFDQMTMDRTRSMFFKRLKAADAHGRLSFHVPLTAKRRLIIVHAKLTIIDDTLLRIGSANMNNRSAGFDTECDLSIEARPDDKAARKVIAGLRTRLLAHWLGCPPAMMEDAEARAGGVGPAIDRLARAGYDRLAPLKPKSMGPLARIIAAFHLGDPAGVGDSWRPWKRKAALDARRVGLAPPPPEKVATAA